MRALIVIVGLLVLLPLDALAGGRRGTIAIVDVNGRQVGTVVGARIADFTIALSVNGRHALLDVVSADSTVYPGLGGFLPFQGAEAGLLLTFETIPGAVPATIAWGSYARPAGCQTLEHPYSAVDLVPAVAVVDLLTLFSPPFRLLFVE